MIANPSAIDQYSLLASPKTNHIGRHATSLLSLAFFLSSSLCPVSYYYIICSGDYIVPDGLSNLSMLDRHKLYATPCCAFIHTYTILHHCVKSGSTPVGGPVKSRRRQTKKEGRGLDKRLVRPELVTTWIQRLRTTSVDPLRRFRSRRGDRDRDGDGQDQE